MYKKFSVEQLKKIKTTCFESILTAMKKEGIPYFKKFLKTLEKNWSSTTYFSKSYPILRIEHKDKHTIYDEKEKIKIELSNDEINELHNTLKNQKKLDRMMKKNKSMLETLWEEFQSGEYNTIWDKPYLVYDIETTFATKNLKKAKFIIAYLISTENWSTNFKYIWPNSCEKLYQYLLDFNGYIIGYNNIAFDNPVTAYNAWWTKEEIEKINKKSIDPFLFLWNITWKRRSLNKVSQSLIWLTKTLESWQEAEVLYNKYLETNNEQYMKELKKYCKNDVKMTLLVLMYLLKYKRIYNEWSEQQFTIQDLILHGNDKKKQNNNTAKSIF